MLDDMRSRLVPSLLFLALLLAPALAGEGPWPLDQAPPALQEAAKPAVKAFQDLGGTLKARLTGALKEKGASGAIVVCRTEAPELTTTVARNSGLELGRSSHRLRNPKNAPRPWVKRYLDRYSAKPAKEAPVELVDLGGGRLGVISPIGMAPLCVTCHGDPKGMSAELRAALAESYPDDRATGFKPGELRGVFWAEVPR